MRYMKLTDLDRSVLMASLATMGQFLRASFSSLTHEEALIPGPAGAFSPVEQVWHLADLEREGFGLRIRRLREEAEPHLADFDGTRIAAERNYRALSLTEGLSTFEAARAANIAVLLALEPQEWLRSGTQDGVGNVSLCDMPVFLRQHDEAHIAEIRDWQKCVGRVPNPEHRRSAGNTA
jgi:DinB superfamily